MICPFCSTPTIPAARYCHQCGAPLSPEASAPSTERRYVTVLFADLSDFTTWSEGQDPERVSSVTDRLLAECVNSVNTFGGHVDKLTGDGLMAVFGAPLSHEDDAERAVRAAAAMQKRVRKLLKVESGGGLPIGLRIGLRTGLVVSGMQASLEYTVIGDTVNTAARICDKATTGTIWAGATTIQATRHMAVWRKLQPVRLKGKRAETEVYQLLGLEDEPGTRASLGDTAPFIGREAELGRVAGRLDTVRDRREPLVVIHTAEAGMGKTRFAREIRTLATERGVRTLSIRSAPYGEARRFGPLADLVRKAAGLSFDMDRTSARNKLRRITADSSTPVNLEVLLGLLGHRHSPDDSGPGGFIGDKSEAQLVPITVANLLTAIAETGPMALILDDLHTATDEGLDALGTALSRIEGPVLTMIFGRPELTRMRPPRTPGHGRDAGPATRVSPLLAHISEAEVYPLPPLNGSEAARLLTAFLDGGKLPKRDEEKLLGFAQGNPYYLAELITLLTEQDLLVAGDDEWHLAVGSLTGKVLSRDLAQVLGARIDALGSAARSLLRASSVFGDAIGPEATELLRKELGSDFDGALQELLDRRMLRRRSYGGYRFVTPLLREAAYTPIGKADAAHAHAEIARWAATMELDGQSADDLVVHHAKQAAELAGDLEIERADEVWDVVPLALEAVHQQALRAMNSSEPDRAIGLLDGIEKLHPLGPNDRLLRARALARLGRVEQAEAEIDALAENVGLSLSHPQSQPQETDANLTAQLLLLRGRIQRYLGELEAARSTWQAALDIAKREQLPGPRCDAECRLGMLDFLGGRLSEAEEHFHSAYEVADEADDERREAWALQHRAWADTARGDFSRAEDALRRAAKIFARNHDQVGRAWVRGANAFTLLLAGRYGDAKRLAETFLPIGERAGDLFAVGLLRAIHAAALVELGEGEGADQEAREAFADFHRINDDWGKGFATLVRALIADRFGARDEALELSQQAETFGALTGQALLVGLSHIIRGRTLLEAGDISGAQSIARDTLQRISPTEVRDNARAAASALLADTFAAQGDVPAALAELEPLVQQWEEPSLGWPRNRIVARYAQLLDDLGDFEEGRYWAEKTLEAAGEDDQANRWATERLNADRR
ncbi:adenylate/guanylate cyclase domain-containing protein [Haloglycomyces albus]|uniref:adenylate/guanylate cyclase domain-containing protein n=1 Tax=Haloglycomyces albus TaxID=526067 RepID=UPI0004B7503C|nr:adenylate/guanylate cyclase domain-containing protein [Haloglycomyces albus]